ncbi:MAG: hypothetical protein LBP35_01075 [Candidatus Ancillula trichonymphae]|jgi:hypothetical protein|nr:hypothetical protein [Candidatus Ancillula trichonymphae]
MGARIAFSGYFGEARVAPYPYPTGSSAPLTPEFDMSRNYIDADTTTETEASRYTTFSKYFFRFYDDRCNDFGVCYSILHGLPGEGEPPEGWDGDELPSPHEYSNKAHFLADTLRTADLKSQGFERN